MPKKFADLVELMDQLREPGGCPWDREQTYATLAPFLLEEAYEAFEALEEAREGRPDSLREELGDLLFQIVFQARVAKERSEFTIDDVIDGLHTKMVRRHPHVFGNAQADNSKEVLKNWEAIKAEEKRMTKKAGAPSSAARASPAACPHRNARRSKSCVPTQPCSRNTSKRGATAARTGSCGPPGTSTSAIWRYPLDKNRRDIK